MTEPGWYVNYENPNQMRYHDGQAWTDHVHDDRKNLPAAPVAPGMPPAVQDSGVEEAAPKQDPAWVKAIIYPLVGILCGLMIGGLLFNAIGAITPVTETSGTVRQLDVDFSVGTSSTNRRSFIISGTTAAGDDWEIVDENAYNVLQSEGYPQPVTLAIGDWTGTPERVVGASFAVDHQSTGARIGWGVMLLVSAMICAGAIWGVARNKNGGAVPALLFGFFLLGPGTWLGFQAFQWFQSS